MRSRSGTTLLELVIASTLLSGVVLMTLSLLLRSTTTAGRLTRAAHLEVRGREFTHFCRSTLLTARMSGTAPTVGGISSLGIHSGYTELRFQVPVARDATGLISFGYSQNMGVDDPSGSGPMGVLRFEAEEILKESSASTPAGVQPAASWGAGFPALPVLSTSTHNLDLNRDGDLTDTFVQGRIARYTISSAGTLVSREKLSESVVLQVEPGSAPLYPYDMRDRHTGAPEPLFRFVDASNGLIPGSTPGTTGVALVATVWHGTSDKDGAGFVLRKSSERVRFRNRQQ